ncbi:25da57df-1377-47f1-a42e-d23236cedb74 [Sclerotinia trifoliorum]|uniref:25da57df-1377-47f1-a42e-d23236cedb74 n=1 Tax=Sclerotinia trifoliorum TaxID=28548 RepID=A0A8H2ZNP5_9HELO|nr:25da57df-1377-47f1-a42e-d23236cedb74 [Sclerotinia trifoliorum]
MSSDNQTPDLASVMKILAGLTQARDQQQAKDQQQTQPSTQITSAQIPEIKSHGPATQQQQQQQWPQYVTPPVVHPGHSQAVNNSKVVDPATIIDWSAGLRCVMRTVAKHDHVLQEIRKMIRVQHEHEEQWWKSREALIEKQGARKEGQRKLEEVLKAVGGATSSGASNTSPEELAQELETFDMKVYRAQTQMVREMNGKLRNLGVPFFGTKSELVRISGKAIATNGTGINAAEGEKVMIDEDDLVELQRKMLNILEDLCND